MKSRYLVLVFLIILIAPLGVNAESYSGVVFRPNGVEYSLDLATNVAVFANETHTQNITINGILTVISRDIDLSYVGWGFYVNITREEYKDGVLTDSRELSIPIPPLLVANKVGTRELHPTDVLLDLIRGEYSNKNISDVLKEVYTASPIDDVYIYNVFFIPTDVSVGSQIPFGGVNKTSGESYIKELSITGEEKVSLSFGDFDAWVIEIRASDIPMITDLFGGEFNVSNALLKIFYEKNSGWLVRVLISFDATINETDYQAIISMNGELLLTDPGNIIFHSSYLNNVFGLPSYTMEIISTATVIIVLVRFLRRKE